MHFTDPPENAFEGEKGSRPCVLQRTEKHSTPMASSAQRTHIALHTVMQALTFPKKHEKFGRVHNTFTVFWKHHGILWTFPLIRMSTEGPRMSSKYDDSERMIGTYDIVGFF